MNRGKAWSPAGVTSFFYSSRIDPNALSDEDLLFVGGYGGGLCLSKGVTTEVEVSKERKEQNQVTVEINGTTVDNPIATKKAIEILFRYFKLPLHDYEILVKHTIEVPIGAGFGTSAAGALSTILALSQALGLPITYLTAAHLAHIADIRAGTGLGTVSGITRGGVVLVESAGAPGYDYVDKLIVPDNISVVFIHYAPISKQDIIFSDERLEKITYLGKMTLTKILHSPTISTFMREANEFMLGAGFVTARLSEAINTLEEIKNKIIGFAQNMIGEGLHVILYDKYADELIMLLKKKLDGATIFKSKIYSNGATVLW